MCGIVGIVGLNSPVLANVLQQATNSLTHRGPDDGGTVVLRDSANPAIEIGLGNRRLAILDLSPLGHQPMRHPATGNWIVFNGEIYNFREVREKLSGAGFQFQSNSDTEVILKAYAHWGETCLGEFRGMFAFAIWDAHRHRLFLARDPMGIKPLYYFESEKYFLFSSEVRTLLGTDLVPRKIDPAGLQSFLAFGSPCEPDTFIEGVKALPPGHWLTWNNGQRKQSHYWELGNAEVSQAARQSGKLDVPERHKLEAQVFELLDESVRMQLVSDVPVGVFLSGGIDSSTLVGILSGSGIRPSTFSILFRESEYSEVEYSRAIARHFRTDHHEIMVSQSDLLAAIDPAIQAMDLPTIDGINTFFVSEKTRAAGVKVALSGLGGDELFAGYSSFHTVPRMRRVAQTLAHLPSTLRGLLSNTYASLAPSNDQNRKLATLIENDLTDSYFLSRMLFTPGQRDKLLVPGNCALEGRRQLDTSLNEILDRARNLDPINRVSYLEARCYMLNTLLRDSDFMSMAHGLEVRVPLIDHQLARRVLALPGSWKMDSRTPKPLLVKALGGQLPDKIVHRPKRGFTLPFEPWLRDALRPAIEKSLGKIGEGPLGALIDEPQARAVWHDFLAGTTSWSRPWSLYVLQSWCQRHLSN